MEYNSIKDVKSEQHFGEVCLSLHWLKLNKKRFE